MAVPVRFGPRSSDREEARVSGSILTVDFPVVARVEKLESFGTLSCLTGADESRALAAVVEEDGALDGIISETGIERVGSVDVDEGCGSTRETVERDDKGGDDDEDGVGASISIESLSQLLDIETSICKSFTFALV